MTAQLAAITFVAYNEGRTSLRRSFVNKKRMAEQNA